MLDPVQPWEFENGLKASANARNNTQHCWAQQFSLLLRDVSRCVQTLATSHMLGLRIQRTLGRFPSPTPCWFLVRMYLCGYVACSARALAQHCWMCCANERNIVGPRFDDRETIEMLALVGSEVWPVSNFIQQLPTSRNNTQHRVQTLATCWAQQCCERLHGPLQQSHKARISLVKKKKVNCAELHVRQHIWNDNLQVFTTTWVYNNKPFIFSPALQHVNELLSPWKPYVMFIMWRVAPTMLEELRKRIQCFCATLRRSRNERNVALNFTEREQLSFSLTVSDRPCESLHLRSALALNISKS